MNNIFFIADTHFGDNAIRLYENRPFPSVKAMDEEMIYNWNNVVSPSDTVYHLGDFGAAGHESDILSRLNGHKKLIKGNHDQLSVAEYMNLGFETVYDMPVVFQQFWILSHEPMYINRNMPYANIFGHVHCSPLYLDFSKQHFCACVERCSYSPVPFETIQRAVLGNIN